MTKLKLLSPILIAGALIAQDSSSKPDQVALLKARIAVLQTQSDFFQAKLRQCNAMLNATIQDGVPANAANAAQEALEKLMAAETKKCPSGKLTEDGACKDKK